MITRRNLIHGAAGLLLGLVAFLPPAAAAPQWLPVGETDELQDYVDLATIVRKGDRASAWYLDNFFEPQTLPRRKPFQSRKSRLHFDCSKGLFAVDEIILFAEPYGRGGVVQKSRTKKAPKPRFEEVPADSLLEDMMDVACNYRPEAPPSAPGTLTI